MTFRTNRFLGMKLPASYLALTAPTSFLVAFNTTVGVFEVLVVRSWSPEGADRLYSLVKWGYYDNSRCEFV